MNFDVIDPVKSYRKVTCQGLRSLGNFVGATDGTSGLNNSQDGGNLLKTTSSSKLHAGYLMSLAFAKIQLAARSGSVTKLFMIIPVCDDFNVVFVRFNQTLLFVSHLS